MVACDFLTVDSVFFSRLYVLVFIGPATRRVHLGGITAHRRGRWVTQRARELSQPLDGYRFLIRDRDAKFTDTCDGVFSANGTHIVVTPIGAPRANAICERVVGTLRRECLDRLLIFGTRQLEAVLSEYLDHYNSRRPHQSLGQRPPNTNPQTQPPEPGGRVVRRDLLSGLIHQSASAA